MFGNFNLDCDSGCPVLNRQWTLTPASPGAGTVSITYGADCLDGFNPQGTCPLTLSGTASLDNNLFEATCPNLVTDLAPCGSDKTGDTGPYVQFANASNVDLVVSGPGPGSNRPPIAPTTASEEPASLRLPEPALHRSPRRCEGTGPTSAARHSGWHRRQWKVRRSDFPPELLGFSCRCRRVAFYCCPCGT